MDEQPSENLVHENGAQHTPKKSNINIEIVNNNGMTSALDEDVFVDSKKQLNLNDGFTSPAILHSPSRQQVIGDVIKEVISDHLNGDSPVPRMVPLDDEDTKNELNGVNSETEMVKSEKEVPNNDIVELNGFEDLNGNKNNENEVINPSYPKIIEDKEIEEINMVDDHQVEKDIKPSSENVGTHETLDVTPCSNIESTIMDNQETSTHSVESPINETPLEGRNELIDDVLSTNVKDSVAPLNSVDEGKSDGMSTQAMPDSITDDRDQDNDIVTESAIEDSYVDVSIKESEEINSSPAIDEQSNDRITDSHEDVKLNETSDLSSDILGQSENEIMEKTTGSTQGDDIAYKNQLLESEPQIIEDSSEKVIENVSEVKDKIEESPVLSAAHEAENKPIEKVNEPCVEETFENEANSKPEESDEQLIERSIKDKVDILVTDTTKDGGEDVTEKNEVTSPTKESGTGESGAKLEETKAEVESKDPEKESQVEEEENKEPEWLDILGNGLLKKKVLKKGLGTDSRPMQGDVVNFRCEGKLDDGTAVDKNSHMQMVLGDADVIQAIDMCIALMEDKETCTLFTDARYAYSIYGRPDYKPPIPQNANLTYELEILSIVRGKSPMEMSTEECVLHSDKKRTRGNDLYSRGNYAGAIDSYKRGLRYLEGRKEKELLDMKSKCLNNLSAAQLKVKAYVMALQSLEVVLELEPKNVKAIYRKAKCLEGLGKDKDALEYMKKASILDPENKSIVQDLGRLRSRVAVTQQKEKEIYQRMFQQNKDKAELDPVEEDDEEEENDNSILPLVGSAMVAAIAVIGGLMWYKYRVM